MVEHTSHPKIGDRIGKYEIRGVLGQGAMGTVYDGSDPMIGRRVAVKTVTLAGRSEQVQEALIRFRQGAQAAGRLNHPNIVAVFDYGEAEDYAYIVMELVNGRPLDDVLEREGKLPLPRVMEIMQDVLAALAHSHQHRVIHRDIKPANIMITTEGRAKVTDFGVARIEDASMTVAGAMIGAPAYMSPEQMTGDVADARSDIYSTGVLLYELLTGKRPFEGTLTTIMHQVLYTAPPQPSQAASGHPMLDQIVARAMARDPNDRYQDAAAFQRALQGTLAASTLVLDQRPVLPQPPARPPAPPPAPPPHPAPATRRRSWAVPMLLVGAFLLAAAGSGGWYLVSHRDPGAPTLGARIAGTPVEGAASVAPDRAVVASPPKATAAVPAPSSPQDLPQPVVLPPAQGPTPAPAQADVPRPEPVHAEKLPDASAPAQAAAPTTPVPSSPEAPAGPSPQLALLQPPRAPPETRSLGVVLGILGATLPQVSCTLARAAPSGDGVAVRGIGGGTEPIGRLKAAADASGAGPLDWDVRAFNATPAQCDALDLLRPYVRPVDPSSTGFRVQRTAGPEMLKQNELLKLDAKLPGFAGYLRIDVLQSDGQVYELYPRKDLPDVPFQSGQFAHLGDPSGKFEGWGIYPPFGTDLVVAVASDTRLFAGQRSRSGEKASDYLRDLRRALADLRQRGNRVEVDAVPVLTGP